ncbi:MAG: peptidylprolyl isomerase [Saprospiraceae bacterium]
MALISEIRKHSWVLIVLIALGMGGFVLMDMVSKASRASGSSYTVGTVNGQKIEWPDFQRAERILYPNSTGDVYGQRNYIWNYMVEERLLRDESEDLGLSVGDEELQDLEFGTHLSPIIQRNFRDPNTGQIDMKNLDQIKANLGTGKLQPQLEEYWGYQSGEIKKERIQRKLTNIVKKGIYTPTWMAQQLQAEQGATLDFKYVKIPLDTTATSEVTLTDDDFKAFMKENEGLMKKKEEFRTVDFVVFNVVPTAEDSALVRTAITDRIQQFREAKNDSLFVENNYGTIDAVYYKKDDLAESIADTAFKLPIGSVYGPYIDGVDMKVVKILDRKIIADSVKARHILIRAENAGAIASARKTIDSLRTLIESGKERFDSLAMKVSQDGSGPKGGDLGYSAINRMVKPFNDALFFAGKKEGDLQVVTTQFGVHLIEITGKKFIKNTEGVKLAYLIEPIVPSENTQSAIYDDAIEFSGQNRTVEALHKAVEAKPELSIETAEGLTTNGYQFSTLGSGGTSRDIIRWAFKNDTKLGSVSPEVFVYDEPTLFYNAHYVVPGLKTIMKPGTYTLAEVKEKYKQKVLEKKQAELIASKITSTDLQAIADQFHVPIDTFKNVNFNMSYLDGIGGETALIGRVSIMKVGETSKPIAGQTGTFVAQVINMAEPNVSTDLSSFKNQSLMVARGSVDSRLMEVLKAKAKLSDNRYTFY